MNVNYHVGNLISSDTFYNDESDVPETMRSASLWSKMGVMAIEMEAAALYMNAARSGKNALAICTVSDHILPAKYGDCEIRFNVLQSLSPNSAASGSN